MKTPKYEYWQGATKEWYFPLKAKNGKIVLQSEGYKTKRACLDTIKLIQENFDFPVIEIK